MSGTVYQVNVSAYLSVAWIFLGILTTYIMYEYPNHKVFPFHTYPTVFVQYFCAFGIILLVPLDLAVTIIGRNFESEQSYYDKNIHTIINMYLSLYWPTLILSNVILVFQEQYNMDGFFTVKTKIANTFVQLGIQTAAAVVAGVIFFSILIARHVIGASGGAILLTAVLITNTIGLTFLMFLFGYGLVMFPITLWKRGSLNQSLLQTQHKAAQKYEVLSDISLEISLCVSDVLKTKEELARCNNSELKSAIQILASECPEEFKSSKTGNIAIDPKTKQITIGSLAALRQKLYWNKASYTMAQQRINKIQSHAYFLEDLIKASTEMDSNKTVVWSFKPEGSRYEYMWYIKVQPILYRFGAVICGIVSLLSYLGVIGSIGGVPLQTSPYYVAVHDNTTTGSGITIFVLLTLGYACYVTMWALFEMKIAGIMELVDNKGTWPLSMSFNARMVARLSAPLAFFYLGWVHENGVTQGQFEESVSGVVLNTAFSRFYQIQVIPIMGNSFNTFFPVLMMCVSALTATNIFNRLCVLCKCPGIQFGQTILSEDVLAEGKKKLADKKKVLERAYERRKLHKKVVGTVSDGIVKVFALDYWKSRADIEEGDANSDTVNPLFGFGSGRFKVSTVEK